jgi:DNA-binding CsgD family transcriptional regulator
MISLFDPGSQRQVMLAQAGYPDRVRAYMNGVEFAVDLETVGLRRRALPTRVRDVPVPLETVPVWRDYLMPAGFRDGYAAGLFTEDGRFLGVLGTSSATSLRLSEQQRRRLYRLVPTIARAVDPLRDLAVLAGMVADAGAGVVLTRAGGSVALPGLPGHGLLDVDSLVVAAALRCLDGGALSASFLCPADDADPVGLVKVTALACPAHPPGNLLAVVLLSPPRATDLTRRELQVLGLLVEGWTTARIAAALYVTARTVVTHLEHVMLKLSTPSRTVAAVVAQRRGLYIPAELTLPPSGGSTAH